MWEDNDATHVGLLPTGGMQILQAILHTYLDM